MKREIIKINEEKCNGCGNCIPGCPEGALQIIDGKARLISELFCDGLGACIGECPVGAISKEYREAEEYDERKVMEENIIKAGKNTIKAHLKHLRDHGETGFLNIAKKVLKEKEIAIPDLDDVMDKFQHCPGVKAHTISREEEKNGCQTEFTEVKSQLKQWPTQLTLVSPTMPVFKKSDLLISADCVPFAYGNFHNDFLKGKTLVHFCPKLDSNLDQYLEKLALMLKTQEIKSITIARMEVPCCGGVEAILKKAIAIAGVEQTIDVKIVTISGTIKQ